MPPPENVAGIQRILGMSQYLSKFLPRLSDITKPLRDLTRQDAEWIWDEPQQSAFERLKQAVSATSVLRYYNAYIYGRDCVRVQTNHKPLESIFRRELCTAPKRLQRMLLRL